MLRKDRVMGQIRNVKGELFELTCYNWRGRYKDRFRKKRGNKVGRTRLAEEK